MLHKFITAGVSHSTDMVFYDVKILNYIKNSALSRAFQIYFENFNE